MPPREWGTEGEPGPDAELVARELRRLTDNIVGTVCTATAALCVVIAIAGALVGC